MNGIIVKSIMIISRSSFDTVSNDKTNYKNNQINPTFFSVPDLKFVFFLSLFVDSWIRYMHSYMSF